MSKFLLLPLASVLLAHGAAAQTITAPRAPADKSEWRAAFSFSGASDIAEGSRPLGEIKHTYAAVEGSTSVPLTSDSGLVLGATWKRFDFSGSRADVPDSLAALAVKLGYTRTLSPQWSLRAEIDPGLYSDWEDLGSGDFNVPFGARLLYAQSRDLQWGFALFVDPRGGTPVVGGVGARWRFAPDWTLLAFLPEPRVEYAVSPQLALFAGASLRGGTFRVAEDFGRRRGRPALDDQDVDFREISVGAGARWSLPGNLTLHAGAGWILDRRFEYEDRDLLLNGDGAPQFLLSLSGSF